MIPRPTLVLIGGGTVVERSRVLAIIDAAAKSLPLMKYREYMGQNGRLVDITKGRAVRCFILTDSNHLFLSSVHAETIKSRLEDDDEL